MNLGSSRCRSSPLQGFGRLSLRDAVKAFGAGRSELVFTGRPMSGNAMPPASLRPRHHLLCPASWPGSPPLPKYTARQTAPSICRTPIPPPSPPPWRCSPHARRRLISVSAPGPFVGCVVCSNLGAQPQRNFLEAIIRCWKSGPASRLQFR